jgi:hypothetical protein
MILIFCIFSFVLSAKETPPRVLENNLIHVNIAKIDRPTAEPASKPYEIALTILCKNTKSTKKVNFPVCDFDVIDKEHKISHTDISIAYFPWDGVKSNNPQGRLYCDNKNKLFYTIKIADVCK